jgi:hypothetical protein
VRLGLRGWRRRRRCGGGRRNGIEDLLQRVVLPERVFDACCDVSIAMASLCTGHLKECLEHNRKSFSHMHYMIQASSDISKSLPC